MSLSYDRARYRPRSCTKKARAERAHAKHRALERYGLNLSTSQLHRLVDDIMNNLSVQSWQQSLAKSRHLIYCQNVLVLVVYDKRRKEIVTFLPLPEEVRHVKDE